MKQAVTMIRQSLKQLCEACLIMKTAIVNFKIQENKYIL